MRFVHMQVDLPLDDVVKQERVPRKRGEMYSIRHSEIL